MLKDIHSQEGFYDSIHISNEGKIEIVQLYFWEAFDDLIFLEGLVDIEFEATRYEEARKDNISKSDHTISYISFTVEIRKR